MEAKDRLFDLGMQYYIAGRFAACASVNPVCGNLFHHAIEMFLKGALSSTMSLKELKRISHRLRELWDAFKTQADEQSLARFDVTIDDLDAFETIRYPDRVLKDGMQSCIGFERSEGATNCPQPFYRVVVPEVDELALAIFNATSVNPAFFTSHLSSDALEYLRKENEWWKACGMRAG